MVSFNEMKIQEIVEDATLTTDQKIERLREIETEARALQRTASESPDECAGWLGRRSARGSQGSR